MTLRLRMGRFLWKNRNFNGKIYKKSIKWEMLPYERRNISNT